MALDLFFAARKPAFVELRAADFSPTPTMLRARRKLIKALESHYSPCRLEGGEISGTMIDFPRGELSLFPGYLHWSLHGVEDEAPIRKIVDWFLEQNFVCIDPQGAGFDNRVNKAASRRLLSFEELVGAMLLGVRLDRNYGFGLGLDWQLADGSIANIEIITFKRCLLPDLGRLVELPVHYVDFEAAKTPTGFANLVVNFADDLELRVEELVYRTSRVTPG